MHTPSRIRVTCTDDHVILREGLRALIEITPFNSDKYEIDKVTGYLRVVDAVVFGGLCAIDGGVADEMIPGHPSAMVIREIYVAAHAQQVMRAPMDNYTARFELSDRKDP